MTARAAALGALAAGALAASTAAAQTGPVFLMEIEVESLPGLALGSPLLARIELHADRAEKAASLREWFPAANPDGSFVTVALAAARATTPPRAAERGASWFVDSDHPAVDALREKLGKIAPRDGPAAISRLVDEHITKKTLERLLDPASTVARRREGDCTEHAVLTAAVARAAGLPARVVLGMALIAVDGGRIRAMGHAWAEVHDGRRWTVADATGLDPAKIAYLPLGVLKDEGPSYVMGIASVLSPADVKRLVLAPVAARAPSR